MQSGYLHIVLKQPSSGFAGVQFPRPIDSGPAPKGDVYDPDSWKDDRGRDDSGNDQPDNGGTLFPTYDGGSSDPAGDGGGNGGNNDPPDDGGSDGGNKDPISGGGGGSGGGNGNGNEDPVGGNGGSGNGGNGNGNGIINDPLTTNGNSDSGFVNGGQYKDLLNMIDQKTNQQAQNLGAEKFFNQYKKEIALGFGGIILLGLIK